LLLQIVHRRPEQNQQATIINRFATAISMGSVAVLLLIKQFMYE
jgi:hypothetical protein